MFIVLFCISQLFKWCFEEKLWHFYKKHEGNSVMFFFLCISPSVIFFFIFNTSCFVECAGWCSPALCACWGCRRRLYDYRACWSHKEIVERQWCASLLQQIQRVPTEWFCSLVSSHSFRTQLQWVIMCWWIYLHVTCAEELPGTFLYNSCFLSDNIWMVSLSFIFFFVCLW